MLVWKGDIGRVYEISKLGDTCTEYQYIYLALPPLLQYSIYCILE